LMGEGEGGGDLRDFFTPSGRGGWGVKKINSFVIIHRGERRDRRAKQVKLNNAMRIALSA